MKFRVLGLLAATVLVVASFAVAGAQNVPPTPPPPLPPGSATPPPGIQVPLPAGTPPSILTPVPNSTATAAPTPTPVPRGRRNAAPAPSGSASASTPAPKGSDVPPPPQYSTLDGVWEVEMQTPRKTFYSHFRIAQTGQGGADVSGFWEHDGKKTPLAGTFDGRLFTFTATDPPAKHYTFSGYVENFSDIVGLISDGTAQTPFTAQHRKKERGLNITPSAGGGGRF